MPNSPTADVVVVGLGLAGLVAGLAACKRGARPLLVGRGFGTLRFRSGTIDVLGRRSGRLVASPGREVEALASTEPQHPYALARPGLEPALAAVRAAAESGGVELVGDLDRNRLVATAAGTLRPACLVPPTMDAQWDGAQVLVVGLDGFRDFHAHLVAAALPAAAARLGLELSARPATIDLPALARRHLDGLALARLFDTAEFRRQLGAALQPLLAGATIVALPAAIGLEEPAEAAGSLADQLGLPVLELPTVPPSVPGLRLERALTSALRRAGGRLQVGVRAQILTRGHRVEAVELDAPARPFRLRAARVVLASGGFASGGLEVGPDGGVRETILGLPVQVPEGELFAQRFLEPSGHPLSRAGIRVDARMRPLGADGEPVHEGLFAAGGIVGGADRAVEKSADGIACATGWLAGWEAAA